MLTLASKRTYRTASRTLSTGRTLMASPRLRRLSTTRPRSSTISSGRIPCTRIRTFMRILRLSLPCINHSTIRKCTSSIRPILKPPLAGRSRRRLPLPRSSSPSRLRRHTTRPVETRGRRRLPRRGVLIRSSKHRRPLMGLGRPLLLQSSPRKSSKRSSAIYRMRSKMMTTASSVSAASRRAVAVVARPARRRPS